MKTMKKPAFTTVPKTRGQFAHDTYGSLHVRYQPAGGPAVWRLADIRDRARYARQRKDELDYRQAMSLVPEHRPFVGLEQRTISPSEAYAKHLKRLAKKSRANRSR